jgi:hypothetical protein
MRDILFQDAVQYKFDNAIYISYQDEKVKIFTIQQLGGQIIDRVSNINGVELSLWLVQSKNDDTYWVSDDREWVYKAFASPF